MKARDLVVFVWLATLAVCTAGEPDRTKGLSAHMLPDRVAQIDGHHGGFTARDANGAESTYAAAKQLVAFFQTLPASTQENGIWVVTTHPTAYSPAERETLRSLIETCRQKNIPVFTCRGSELPGGWKRSEVPTGWNDSSEALVVVRNSSRYERKSFRNLASCWSKKVSTACDSRRLPIVITSSRTWFAIMIAITV